MPNYKFKENIKEVIQIGKLVCLARTYKKHAQEMKSEIPKDPIIFLKPSSAVIFNGGTIIFPNLSKCLHHEVELGVIIGKKCKNVLKDNALDYVLGYCLALDITARDIQSDAKKKGMPWTIAKGFDTFAPISDIVLKKDILDPNNLDLILKVNGEIRQKSNTNKMIFDVQSQIEYISEIMTLEKGDLILTGTPEGVSEIKKGDIIEAKLDNLCFIKTTVK